MNTTFLLLAEFETGDIPLKKIAEKYFSHDESQMRSWARHDKYPFPVYRGGSQKSEWLVSVQHFSSFLDSKKSEAEKRFKALNGHD